MNVIASRDALALARQIMVLNPIEKQSQAPTAGDFEHDAKLYFPELSDLDHLEGFFAATCSDMSCYAFELDALRVNPATGDTGESWRFDLEKTCLMRARIYASGYFLSACGISSAPSIMRDMFDVLSFGAVAPTSEGEMRDMCRNLAFIWSNFDNQWFVELGAIKTGASSSLVERARDAGADSTVEAFLSGVPAEYLVEEPALMLPC